MYLLMTTKNIAFTKEAVFVQDVLYCYSAWFKDPKISDNNGTPTLGRHTYAMLSFIIVGN
jgi:hypothetical protein